MKTRNVGVYRIMTASGMRNKNGRHDSVVNYLSQVDIEEFVTAVFVLLTPSGLSEELPLMSLSIARGNRER